MLVVAGQSWFGLVVFFLVGLVVFHLLLRALFEIPSVSCARIAARAFRKVVCAPIPQAAARVFRISERAVCAHCCARISVIRSEGMRARRCRVVCASWFCLVGGGLSWLWLGHCCRILTAYVVLVYPSETTHYPLRPFTAGGSERNEGLERVGLGETVGSGAGKPDKERVGVGRFRWLLWVFICD